MRKQYFSLIFIAFTFSLSGFGQNEIAPFKNSGVIFSADYKYYSFDNLKRFTPSFSEISELEILLSRHIKKINSNRLNQGNQSLIHRNLKKYKRQYIGYFDEKGERVIYVKFLWKGYQYFDDNGKEIEIWKTQWLEIFDGGSSYWQIKYNPDLKIFSDLAVNGVS